MFAVLVTPILLYLLFLSIHWIPFRLHKVESRAKTMTLTLALVIPLLIPMYQRVSALGVSDDPLWATLLTLTLFTLLWCGYVQFYMAFHTSPSLRTLVELLGCIDESATVEELGARFDFEDTFTRRVQRAIEGGALRQEQLPDGRKLITLTSISRFLGNWGVTLKTFFRLGEGG